MQTELSGAGITKVEANMMVTASYVHLLKSLEMHVTVLVGLTYHLQKTILNKPGPVRVLNSLELNSNGCRLFTTADQKAVMLITTGP